MMQVSAAIGAEITFLGISLLLGVFLAICYDLLRIFRRVVVHGVAWIAVEDFLYWILVTGAVFVVLYQENDGMVRGFAIGGILIGMLLYHAILSRYIVKYSARFLNKIKDILGKVTGVVFGPVNRLLRKAIRFLKKQLKKIWKTVKIGLCKL